MKHKITAIGLTVCVLSALVQIGVTQDEKEKSYPRPEFLIEPSHLAKPDVAKDYIVLDARSHANFERGHVPNAVWVNHDEWAKAFGHGKDADAWGKRIGSFGLTSSAKVIVYDDNYAKDAARIWWILRYWGVEDVRLLNGGWAGWKAGNHPTDKEEIAPRLAKFEAKARPDRLATKEQLLESLKGGKLQIVDARSEKEFCGVEKLTNKRAGAIPGAKQLEWIDLLDKDTQRFKSATNLRKLFEEAGIALDRPTATHCQSGGRAAVMVFGMELMGAKDVSNYYPSFAEWGNDPDTPVVQEKIADPKQTGEFKKATAFAPLPKAVSSFGAVVSDDWLYVYGGHSGKTHEYSTKTVLGTFDRLKLSAPTAWEELAPGPASQGLALVACQGKIYRIGGMQPRNQPGEKADNHSLTTCERYDPESKKWEALPDLPTGRSSHDAVVIGDKIVVIGGWKMTGAGKQIEWHTTALVLDLKQKVLKWETVKQPFQRRALTTAAYDRKVYVIGGMADDAETALSVNIFDPAKNSWTVGPDIPGPKRNGFTPASCVAGGRLYVSPADGKLYRLAAKGGAWEAVGALKQARVVHRMVAVNDKLLIVVGGASKGENLAVIESIQP